VSRLHRSSAHTPEECAQMRLEADEAYLNAVKSLKWRAE
jgi:hypothetical protein